MATKALATTKKGAVATQADLVIIDIPTIAEVTDAIEQGYKLHFDGETQDNVLLSTLKGASSRADLAAASSGGLLKMIDHLGEKIRVTGIDGVNNADPGNDGAGTLGVYLVASIVTRDGEVAKMAVGAKQPFAYIVALNEWGELPCDLSFEKATKPTKNGFFPINAIVYDPDKYDGF
jgi:hypothetical protein